MDQESLQLGGSKHDIGSIKGKPEVSKISIVQHCSNLILFYVCILLSKNGEEAHQNNKSSRGYNDHIAINKMLILGHLATRLLLY